MIRLLQVVFPFAPDEAYEGKTITQIAAMRHETPANALIHLIAMVDEYEKKTPEADNVEGIIGKSMTDASIVSLLSWSNTNVCSDGGSGGHPRSHGVFTRVLSYYVRQKKVLSLENAIYKMTALAAEHVGIQNRGVVVPGYAADLVLFDLATVKDNAAIQAPTALSDGILKVWVNAGSWLNNNLSVNTVERGVPVVFTQCRLVGREYHLILPPLTIQPFALHDSYR